MAAYSWKPGLRTVDRVLAGSELIENVAAASIGDGATREAGGLLRGVTVAPETAAEDWSSTVPARVADATWP